VSAPCGALGCSLVSHALSLCPSSFGRLWNRPSVGFRLYIRLERQGLLLEAPKDPGVRYWSLVSQGDTTSRNREALVRINVPNLSCKTASYIPTIEWYLIYLYTTMKTRYTRVGSTLPSRLPSAGTSHTLALLYVEACRAAIARDTAQVAIGINDTTVVVVALARVGCFLR
jgi:hypothetical protein